MHFHGSGKEIPSVQMPGASTSKGIEDEEIPDVDNKELATNKEPSIYLLKQIPDLITLSLLPKIQWQSLVNLDIIKVVVYIHVYILNLTTLYFFLFRLWVTWPS